MIYVDFDNSNNLLGFYDPDVNKSIPETAKVIDNDVYNSYLLNQINKTIDPDTLQLIDKLPTQQQINTINLLDSFLNIWNTLSLYEQHSNDSIKLAILKYIYAWDLSSLQILANDATVPTDFQPFQQQLKALLTPYLPKQSS